MTGRKLAAPLPDADARRTATSEFETNLVVTAGAGTGKTALLVERTLNLIGSGRARIEELALVTFTEKAAAELRQRLARGLDDLMRRAAEETRHADLDPRMDADRAWGWLLARNVPRKDAGDRALAALRNLDGAMVSTIHAFCAGILRRYPREAGVDPRFTIDEGPAADRIARNGWGQALHEELDPASPRLPIWSRALAAGQALSEIRDLADTLADFKFPDRALVAPVPTPIGELLGEEVRARLAAVNAVLRAATGLAPAMQRRLETTSTLLEGWLSVGPEILRAADPSTIEVLEKKVGAVGVRMQGAQPEQVHDAAVRSSDLLRRLTRIDEEATAAVIEVAAPLAAHHRDELLAQGFISFAGLLRRTRDLLAGNPPVRRALAQRTPYLLVDEFQDTDPLQYEILFFIAETEAAAASDAYRTRLRPGSLFIVGDPKQSIYRFRGADIAAYRRAVSHLIEGGARELTLAASFRSPATLVDPVNRLFDGWIGRGAEWAGDHEPPYRPIISALPPRPHDGPRVEIWSVDAPGNAAERRAGEALAIAAFVAEEAERRGRAGIEPRYRAMALLFRALTHVGLYTRALRGAGVPFVVEGGKDFYSRTEIGDLLSFLRAIANPYDGPAILAVARSPLGAVPDLELARYAAIGGRLDRFERVPIDPAAFPNLDRLFRVLAEFRVRVRDLPPDRIVREATLNPPIQLLHASTWEGAQRVANLRKLVALTQKQARVGLSLGDLIAAIEAEFEGTTAEGESPLADETVDAVRVLSIHKAKGLEYDVVFVPDLGRQESPRHSLPRVRAGWIGPGQESGHLAVQLADGRSNAAWVRYEMESRRHEEAEEKRVFYVACTRARERLILVNSHFKRTAPWRDRLAALGYSIAAGASPPDGPLADGAVAHRTVRPAATRPEPREEHVEERVMAAAAELRKFAGLAAAGMRPPLRWPSAVRHETSAKSPAGPPQGDGVLPRQTLRLAGTAIHMALEKTPFGSGRGAPDRDRLLQTARRVAAGLLHEAPPQARHADLQRELYGSIDEILAGFFASALPARLGAATILGREVPILFRDERDTWAGACDLLFREENLLIVADYKTDRFEGSAEEAALPYREQMRLYVAAIARAFPAQPVRAEVLFLRRGVAVRLEDSA